MEVRAFFNSITWQIIKAAFWLIGTGLTIFIVWKGFPEKTEKLITQVGETHTYVEKIAKNLEDNIEGGQDVWVGISSGANDYQAILLSNSKLPFNEGDSIVLYNEGSNFKPRIKLLVAKVVEARADIEKQNKIQIYINKKAVAMLDYNPIEGQKKLKVLSLPKKAY